MSHTYFYMESKMNVFVPHIEDMMIIPVRYYFYFWYWSGGGTTLSSWQGG
ncbi:hypothetical protein U27_01132 [Candidatus Vecturithrix granuli]|uniref:Uncharacterized protein n=1 Tax=Vecturithrix granuli TaxID=1499967 RepID=A0A081C9H8_VECG1|nr:hypothetical protein U27_01132 [Candidatus Vecturithrix granuli]